MLKEYGLSPLADEALRITLTESLYECGVDENRIVEQLCKHCQCTLEEAIQHVVYEKTTRTPIRALQNYLEREKGFPADSRKSVYGLAFFKMSMLPEIRGASPEEFYRRFGIEFEALKRDGYFRDMRMEAAADQPKKVQSSKTGKAVRGTVPLTILIRLRTATVSEAPMSR